MGLPTTFGTLTSTSGSLSLLDGNFNALGALVTVIGTVTGTNAIAFTPAANNPTVAAYANYMRFGFVAANTSTGTVKFAVGALASLKLFGPDAATQIGSGGIAQNIYYEVSYNSALDTGAGGFQLVSATPANVTIPVTVSQGGTGDTSLTAYAVLTGGTGTTAPVQSIASVGTAGQVLTSNGAGALPTFQTDAPTSSSFPVGTFALLVYTSATPVADGSTVAGSTLNVAVFTHDTGTIVTGGGVQTGTWKNVSGVSISFSAGNLAAGYFVRTA